MREEKEEKEEPRQAAPHLQINEQLLRFQLFQGLSRPELLQLAGTTKFGFVKEPPGRTIATADGPCQQLFFLVRGCLALTSRSADGGYELQEQVSAPWMLQPEALFGARPRFTATWKTSSDCQFITLSKDEVIRLADEFLTVRLNLFNLLATLAQRRAAQQWLRPSALLRERFARFVLDRALYPAGPKELRILIKRLAQELACHASEASRMLHQLEQEQKLRLQRRRITIPSLELLIQ